MEKSVYWFAKTAICEVMIARATMINDLFQHIWQKKLILVQTMDNTQQNK